MAGTARRLREPSRRGVPEAPSSPAALRRIHVIGGPGSGKTTLARQLAARTGLPVHNLDEVARVGGGTGRVRSAEERAPLVREILNEDAWITEGVHIDWTEPFLERADVVVWLDYASGSMASRRIVRRFIGGAIHEVRTRRGRQRFLRLRDYGRQLRALGGALRGHGPLLPASRRVERGVCRFGQLAEIDTGVALRDRGAGRAPSGEARPLHATVGRGGIPPEHSMRQPDVLRSAIDHVRTPLYLNAYALIVSNVVTSGLGVVYWAAAARLYPVEVVGISFAIISTTTFVIGVSQLNLRVALIRLVPAAGAATARLVGTAYAVSLAVTAVVALVVFGGMAALGQGSLSLDHVSSPAGVALLVVAALASTVFNLQDGVLTGLRRTVWVPIENGLYSLVKLLLLIAVVGAFPLIGILVSWFVPIFVAVGLISYALVSRWIPAHIAAGAGRSIAMGRRRLLGFVAADYVGSLCALAITALLPVLIVAGLGGREGAYFSIVWTISQSLNLLAVNMCASMTVETIHANADLSMETRRVALHMARLLIPTVLLLLVFAELVLRVFGADYAANGTTALRLLSIGALPAAVNTLFIATARIRGRGREILAVQAVLATLTLAGGALLVGPLGINGVPMAWLIAQTAVAAVVGGGSAPAAGDAWRRTQRGSGGGAELIERLPVPAAARMLVPGPAPGPVQLVLHAHDAAKVAASSPPVRPVPDRNRPQLVLHAHDAAKVAASSPRFGPSRTGILPTRAPRARRSERRGVDLPVRPVPDRNRPNSCSTRTTQRTSRRHVGVRRKSRARDHGPRLGPADRHCGGSRQHRRHLPRVRRRRQWRDLRHIGGGCLVRVSLTRFEPSARQSSDETV